MDQEWETAVALDDDLPKGGSISAGQEIVFGLAAQGARYWFKFPHQRLAAILNTLRSFGEMAAKARSGSPITSLDDLLWPYRLRSDPRFGHGTDGSIAIQFPTHEGIPLTIAMSRDQAIAFAKKIQTECQKPTPGIRRQ
jgi:hypothetical protein